MGIFGWLFGNSGPKNVSVRPDRIWLTENAKFEGVRRELAEAATGTSIAILLVSHFADVAEQLEQIASEYDGSIPLMAVRASELSTEIARGFHGAESDCVCMIVAERHPLPDQDDAVLNAFAKELPCRCDVGYHVSLDDPILKVFVNDGVRNMIRMLGMQENEAIESNMVRRRIRQAQQKFSQSARGNQPAETADEWMKKNLPQMT